MQLSCILKLKFSFAYFNSFYDIILVKKGVLMLATTFLQNHDIVVTPLRVELVEMLQQANRPISYDEFLSKIKANKSTIYRNLDILLSKNLIIKSEIEHKSFYELSDHAKAYFVCEACHQMEEIEIPNLPGKSIKSAVIKGICEKCS